MNKPRRLRLLPFLFAACAGLPLYGQQYEIGPYFTFDRMSRAPLGTVRQTGGADSDTRWGDGNGIGVRVTLNTKGYYGHEVGFERSHVNLRSNVDEFLIASDGTITLGNAVDRKEKVRQSRLSYNFLMYMMPAGEWWRPYITVGVTSVSTSPPRFYEWNSNGSRNFGANWGGGIKLFPKKNFLVRLDARQIIAGRPYTLVYPTAGDGTGGKVSPGNTKQLEISAGVSFAFGKH